MMRRDDMSDTMGAEWRRRGRGGVRRLLALVLIAALASAGLSMAVLPGVALADAVSVLAVDANTGSAKTVVLGGLRWRVIGYDGAGVAQTADSGTMTLLLDGSYMSDQSYRSQYDQSGNSNRYGGSTLQAKVADIAGSLSEDEQNAIVPRDLAGNGTYGLNCDAVSDSDPVTGQMLWPLSAKEANALAIVLRMVNGYWWLRSPGNLEKCAAFVDVFVGVFVMGKIVDLECGVRPACHVNLASVISTSQITSGGNTGAYELKLKHKHSFGYAVGTGADANKILATCTEGCPDSYDTAPATLAIAAEGGTYDGATAYGATVTNGIPAVGGDTVGSIAYYKTDTQGATTGGTAQAGAPTGAGHYYASVTLASGGSAYTAVKAFTVAKADPTAPTGLTATYGQRLSDVELPDGWTWADGAQSVGSVVSPAATFKASFTGDDNHNSATDVDVAVTVGRAANPATVTGAASVTSGGDTVDLARNVTKNGATGTVSYELSGDANGCSLSGSVLTSGNDTGSVTVNVTIAADDNYNALAATPITVTIDKANAVAAGVAANNRTYDGTERPLATVVGEATGGEMRYALGTDATTAPTTGYAATVPTATDTGTYHVWYKAEGDENHNDSAPAVVTATIAKASIAQAKVTLAQASCAHDGKAKTPAVKSVVLGSRKLAEGTDYTVSYRNNTAPGTAAAVVTGKGNYEGTATASFAITLAKPKLTTFGFTSKSSMDARWGKVAGARAYELQYRKAGGSWKTVAATGTSKTIKGMKSGKLYELRVRATAGSAKGPWSGVSRRYFGGVSGVKATSRKAGTVTASWRKDAKANAGYEVLVRYKKDGAVVGRVTVAAGKTTATVTGLAKGRKVWVEVRPLHKSGGSIYVGVLHGTWGKS